MEKGNDQTRVEVDQMSLTTTRTRLGTTWEFDDDKPLDRRKRSIDQILSGNLLLFLLLLLLLRQSFLIFYLFPISNDAFGTRPMAWHTQDVLRMAAESSSKRPGQLHDGTFLVSSRCLCFSLVRRRPFCFLSGIFVEWVNSRESESQ